MSRQLGELTASEWEALDRARQHDDRHTAARRLPPAGPSVPAVTGHDANVAPTGDPDGSWIAACSCGWSTTTSWRLNAGFPMTERYAWLEADDHAAGLT